MALDQKIPKRRDGLAGSGKCQTRQNVTAVPPGPQKAMVVSQFAWIDFDGCDDSSNSTFRMETPRGEGNHQA